jgi:hypothetical protein
LQFTVFALVELHKYIAIELGYASFLLIVREVVADMFISQPAVVAQAANCYFPDAPRFCQAVKPQVETAQPPTAPKPTPKLGLKPLFGLPLLLLPLVPTGGGNNLPDSPPSNPPGQTPTPSPSPAVPVPMALPGLLLGAGLFGRLAHRKRVTLMITPLFLVSLAANPPAPTITSPEEMVFPVISDNQMQVTYGGRQISLPTPFNIPRDTSKYRYYVHVTEGSWQICWEEVKPEICPPSTTPRRLLW